MGNKLSTSDSQEGPKTPGTSVADLNDVELKTSAVSRRMHMLPQRLPDDDGCLRIWLSPDLSDPELLALLGVFPSFIVQRTLPRFPIRSPRDAEDGVDLVQSSIRAGTGRIWVSLRVRSPGWAGTWWVRFKLWWKQLFC